MKFGSRQLMRTVDAKQGRHGFARCAFTLIELLVGVVIVAILTAILSPALKKAIESAHEARCVSNLHQFGMASRLYANDNDNVIIPAYENPANWRTHMRAMGVTKPSSYLCEQNVYKNDMTGYEGNYLYNLSLGYWGVTPKQYYRYSEVTNPASKPQITDAAYRNSSGGVKNCWFAGVFIPKMNCINFCHRNGANVLFLDGHVSWLAQSSFPNEYGTYFVTTPP